MKRKVCALLLGVALALGCLAGCDTGVPEASVSPVATTAGSLAPEASPAGAEIAMVLTETAADSPYGQSVWATVSRVAGESAVSSGLYRAGEGDDTAARASIELAVKGGARLVVLLGEELAGTAGQVGRFYPEVDFILLDMPIDTPLRQNTVMVRYSPEQSGWLAGYASVYEELGNVAFAAVEDEQALRYTLGFLLGADAAAQDRKAEPGSLKAFALALPENQAEWPGLLQELYQPDTANVRSYFVNQAVQTPAALQAAKEAGGYVSGMAPMLAEEAGTQQVLARVSYDPQNILAVLLAGWIEERFPGGESVEGTVAGGEIGLDLPKEGLGRFNERVYQTILDRFRIGSLSTRIAIDTAPNAEENLPLPEELNLDVLEVLPPAGGVAAVSSLPPGAPDGTQASQPPQSEGTLPQDETTPSTQSEAALPQSTSAPQGEAAGV